MSIRYLLSNRLADSSANAGQTQDQANDTWHSHLKYGSSEVSSSLSDQGRLTFSFVAEPGEVAARKKEIAEKLGEKPNLLIVEKEIPHYRDHSFLSALSKFAIPHPSAPAILTKTLVAPVTTPMTIQVSGTDGPLAGANVTVVLVDSSGNSSTESEQTNGEGLAKFNVKAGLTAALYLIAPSREYWGMLVQSPGSSARIICPPLPRSGPMGWWHHALGVNTFEPEAGKGITIGVADTGVGPNPRLARVKDGGAIIDGQWTANGQDVEYHGSVTCGIIAALPQTPGDYAGVAPGARVVSIRVFPNARDSANQVDVALAIDRLSRTEAADIVNLSLYSTERSEIEGDAIQAALNRGTLCICATGNDGGPEVLWPAAFPEAVAVSGVGKVGVVPPNVVDAVFAPDDPSRYGKDGFYLAKFSNFGNGVAAGAPAVGIIGTVPVTGGSGNSFDYIADSGTSEAAPATASVLASLLAQSPLYFSLPRTAARAAFARKTLTDYLTSIGLAKEFSGGGLPVIPSS
jgi:Subtilase family